MSNQLLPELDEQHQSCHRRGVCPVPPPPPAILSKLLAGAEGTTGEAGDTGRHPTSLSVALLPRSSGELGVLCTIVVEGP